MKYQFNIHANSEAPIPKLIIKHPYGITSRLISSDTKNATWVIGVNPASVPGLVNGAVVWGNASGAIDDHAPAMSITGALTGQWIALPDHISAVQIGSKQTTELTLLLTKKGNAKGNMAHFVNLSAPFEKPSYRLIANGSEEIRLKLDTRNSISPIVSGDLVLANPTGERMLRIPYDVTVLKKG